MSVQKNARHESMAQPLAFIKVMTIDGTRTCVLFDEDGDEIALSEFGMVPLISYAIGRGMTLCTVH